MIIIIILLFVFLFTVVKYGSAQKLTIFIYKGFAKKNSKLCKQFFKNIYYKHINCDNIYATADLVYSKQKITDSKYLQNIKTHRAEFIRRSGYVYKWSIPLKKVGNRSKYFKYTIEDWHLVCAKYYNLEMYTRGNQWTMLKAEIRKQLNGYVETFASPFNVTTKHFGSIFKSDKAFGRVGLFQDIVDKYDNLVISPPSGDEISEIIYNKVSYLLQNKKVNILLGFRRKDLDKYLTLPYIKDYIFNDFCYDHYNKIYINMENRHWYLMFLSSKGDNMQIRHPKESPYEKEV